MSAYLDQDGAAKWVPVPVTFSEQTWESASEWAAWFAEAASRGRERADLLRDAIFDQCMLIVGYPAEGVAARFWHYPVDGTPSGFVDVRVASLPEGAGEAAQLLDDAGETAVLPVVTEIESAVFNSAVRRLTLRQVMPEGGEQPGTLAVGEWIGVVGDTVCSATSFDSDVESLSSRLEDTGELFAAFGEELAAGPFVSGVN